MVTAQRVAFRKDIQYLRALAIDAGKFRTVVLSAAWDHKSIIQVGALLREIHSAQLNVLVIGPLPRWTKPLEVLFPASGGQSTFLLFYKFD